MASTAGAQVACTVPDDLCTGDPCVIHDIQILTPCVLNFGTRTVEIAGRLRVKDPGNVSFNAGAFHLRSGGAVNGDHLEPGGVGSQIQLVTAGNADLEGRILLSGTTGGGSLQVLANGTISVTGAIRALADKSGSGGSVMLQGDAGVSVDRFMDVRGPAAGSIQLLSSAGDVTLSDNLKLGGTGVHVGGSVVLTAGGNVTVTGRITATGSELGGSVLISTAGAPTTGNVMLRTTAKCSSKIQGGAVHVALAPTGALTGSATFDISSSSFGGSVCVEGGAVNASINVKGKGTPFGGQARIQATGDLVLHGTLDVRMGTIEVKATGNLATDARFDNKPPACLAIACGGTCVTTGARIGSTPVVADCFGDCP